MRKSLQSTEQLLKTAYTQAVNEGDAEKQMDAQQRIAQLAIEKERLSLRKRKVEQQEIQKNNLLKNLGTINNKLNHRLDLILKLKIGLKITNGLEQIRQ